jgi:hypothetical protein
LDPIRWWTLELSREPKKGATLWEVHAKGEATPHMATSSEQDVIQFESSAASAGQALRALADVIDEIDAQRTTGVGIDMEPVVPPFNPRTGLPSDWNTDGDVPSDNLTGRAS